MEIHNTRESQCIETTSRKLEQFLYMHDIFHTSWKKDAYNMTVWVYPATKEVMRPVCKGSPSGEDIITDVQAG